ncbi:leucine efflux protein LeuE [Dactylosporangium aurantiacum]|uniref:Leucine efflux protein LeuE n=1 Tax=Dactylosporangium aurantiacum TaxID=35754 RepID=A0A9Q9IMQ7_9ACTN|nr:leucine efflux protein LeuE [Dactylosporangium aurantiacum]MDG6104553.1 leucine efflux protein LeuE [Dactylosporangium aurantiacum]UWZ56164.1 leucine efflux protein LeuE [Dactylosporangium aurantiacum]
MLGVTNPWTYVLGTAAIVLLPGPNSLYVLSVAVRRGVRDGYRGAAGVWLGDAVLMTLSAGGVASLLHTYPWLFVLVKYAGAGYLAYIGVRLVVDTVRRLRAPASAPRPEPPADRPFRRALTISLLNPKAILFFVSFFIQFVDPDYPYPAVSFLLLGIVAEVLSAVYLTVLIFAGRRLAEQFRARRGLAAGLSTTVGGLFLAFSVKLATASLS